MLIKNIFILKTEDSGNIKIRLSLVIVTNIMNFFFYKYYEFFLLEMDIKIAYLLLIFDVDI